MTSADLDLTDFYADSVVSGLVVTQDTGLDGDITGGDVYITQAKYTISPVTGHTFTASVDTYVDVGDDTVITYTEVANGAGAPALAADAIRLAKVVTDGTGITGITDLRTIWEGVFAFGTVTLVGTGMTLYNAGSKTVYYRHGAASTSGGIPIAPADSVTVDETVYVKPNGVGCKLIVTG